MIFPDVGKGFSFHSVYALMKKQAFALILVNKSKVAIYRCHLKYEELVSEMDTSGEIMALGS